MRIITWNVNSIRVRIDQVGDVLRRHEPDVLCLQELKLPESEFPYAELEAEGYRACVAAQPTYNGVAILARDPLEDTVTGFSDGEDEDPQQRIVRATVKGVRIVGLYVPNGESVDSEKYEYKLAWFDRLRRMFDTQEDPGRPTAVVGDFNVAPADLDVYNPRRFEGKVLCSDPERGAFRNLLDWGLTDCLRERYPDDSVYTWWDYRFRMFEKKKGLRIDHILATPSLAKTCEDVRVDLETRGAGRPSDHAPVIGDFAV